MRGRRLKANSTGSMRTAHHRLPAGRRVLRLSMLQPGQQRGIGGRIQRRGPLLQHRLRDDEFATRSISASTLLTDTRIELSWSLARSAQRLCSRRLGVGTRVRRRLGGLRRIGRHRLDAQFALVLDPCEGFVDDRARHVARQRQIPCEIGFVRIALRERRQPFVQAGDAEFAVAGEFTQDAQRIVAAAEQRRCRRKPICQRPPAVCVAGVSSVAAAAADVLASNASSAASCAAERGGVDRRCRVRRRR
jgi:hypothetical protein